MQTSRLLSMFEEGEPVWMVNPGGASIDVVDMLARVGVRCVFVDCERTAVHIESVTAMVRCASSHGMATVVRSESMQPEILVRYLDRGIDGIVVPHVETVRQLQAIAEVVAYVTKGRERRVYAIAQIESHEAVDNVAALAVDPGVDGFLIGPNDLAHSMGCGGDTRRAEVVAAVEHVATVLQHHGRAWGLPALHDSAVPWARRGARLMYCTMEQILGIGYAPFAAAIAPRPKSSTGV